MEIEKGVDLIQVYSNSFPSCFMMDGKSSTSSVLWNVDAKFA